MQLHYIEVKGKKRIITDRVLYTQPLFKLIKIVNATSFPGLVFRYPPSFGHQSVYLWLKHRRYL